MLAALAALSVLCPVASRGQVVLDGTSRVVDAAGNSISTNGTLFVGTSGTAALTLKDGGTVSANVGKLGVGESGLGTATVNGGTWTNDNDLNVGFAGTGVLNLNGGLVVNGNGYLASIPGSNGTATVTGGTWQNNGNLYVGNGGTGVLNVNGGLVMDVNGYIGLVDPFDVGNFGAVTVTSGTWANAGAVVVGCSAPGALNLDGGLITSSSGWLGLNNKSGEGCLGTATVTGGTWQNTGNLYVGCSGSGVLKVSGGLVSNQDGCLGGVLGMGGLGFGTATVTGGTWQNNGNLYVGYSGSGVLKVSGGLVSNQNGYIGFDDENAFGSNGGVGTATVTSGTWANAGNLYVGYGGSGVLNLSGSGVVTVGSGTVTLAATSTAAGTLNFGTGPNDLAGTLNAAAIVGGTGTGGAVVNFNHAGPFTPTALLQGSLSVNQLNGVTLLTGHHTYTGLTTVSGGALVLNGSIPGAVSVLPGGFLCGAGAIGGSVTNHGLVRPGDTPGQLTLGGGYTQGADGTLAIRIASGSLYDRLAVGGPATLGGTLAVSTVGGYVIQKGDRFQVLTAAAVNGAFQSVTGGLPLTVSYTPESVWLQATAARTWLADYPGLTPNQHAAAKALDGVSGVPSMGPVVKCLADVPPAKFPAYIEKLVPTDFLPMFEAVMNTNQVQGANLERRLWELRNGAAGFSASGLSLTDSHGCRSFNGAAPAPGDRLGYFVNGSGEFVAAADSAIAYGSEFRTGGVTAGADYRLGEHVVFGLSAGYANTVSDGKTERTVQLDSGKLTAYASVFGDGFFLNGAAGGGLNDYTTRRASLGGPARGETDGSDFNALLGGGYTLRRGGWAFGPTASLRYDTVAIRGFTERGSLAPLRISEQSEASLKSALGAQVSYTAKVGKTTVTPQLRAQWQRQHLSDPMGIGASYLPGGSFTVFGPVTGRDSLLLDAGASVQLTPAMSIYACYGGDFGQGFTSHSVNAGLQLSF